MTADAYTLACQRMDSLTGRKIIIGTINVTGLGLNTGYPLQVAGANYQVTAGKNLYLTGIFVTADTNSGGSLDLRSATNVTLLGSPVIIWLITTGNVVKATTNPLPVIATVAQNLYVGCMNGVAGGTCSIMVVGYEA
jgi:hypothetical protein